MKNRILAYLLCVLMLVGMVPVSVSAADVVATIGTTGYDTLQKAIDAASGDTIITLSAGTIDEDVIIHQQEGVNITIKGNGSTTIFSGYIEVYGHCRHNGAETLTFDGVVFQTTEAEHVFIEQTQQTGKTDSAAKCYPHNITVKNSKFVASGDALYTAVGMKYRYGYNIKVETTTGEGLHSLMQNYACVGMSIEEVGLTNCKSGISLGSTTGVVVKDFTVDSVGEDGYGLRFDANYTGSPANVTIEDCTIEAFAPVLVRKATTGINLTIAGENEMTANNEDENWLVVSKTDYDKSTEPEAPANTVPVNINLNTALDSDKIWTGESDKVHVNQSAAEIDGVYFDTVAAAIAASTAGDEIKVLENVSWPNGLDVKNKEITIVGASKSIVIDYTPYDSVGGDTGGRYGNDSKLTFKNITLKHTNRNYRGWKHSISETYENCIIEGQIWTYGVASFKNCTFNQTSADAYNIWTYGALTATFTDCTFNSAGKAALVYKEHGSTVYTASFKNCTFNASAPVTGKAAIEIDSSLNPYKVTVENCTANGFDKGSVSGNTLWNVKKGADKVEVVANTITWDVDGTKTTVAGTYPEVIVKPADPTKYGFIFAGWEGYTEGMTMPANDVVFTAKWTRDASVPVVLGIEAAVTELVGGGEIALTVTTDAPDLLGAVVVTCDDPDVVITGSGANWTATVPDATKSYTFTVAFNDTVTGFGEPTDTCVVAVSKTPSSKQEPAFDYVLFALAARYAQRYDVLVSADNATVTGDMTIKYKRAGTVEIAVAEGYQLVDVIANGQSLGAVTSVTFKKVMAPQTLVVVTEPIPTEEPVVEAPAA